MPAPRTAPPRPAPVHPPIKEQGLGPCRNGAPLSPKPACPYPPPRAWWHGREHTAFGTASHPHGTGLGTGGCRLWNITSDSNGLCRRSRPALTARLMGQPVLVLKPTDGNSHCGTFSLAQEGTAVVPPSLSLGKQVTQTAQKASLLPYSLIPSQAEFLPSLQPEAFPCQLLPSISDARAAAQTDQPLIWGTASG